MSLLSAPACSSGFAGTGRRWKISGCEALTLHFYILILLAAASCAAQIKGENMLFMFHDIFIFFLQHNSRLLTAWFSEELGKSLLASEPGTVESSPSAALPGRNSTSRCHQSSASSDSPSSSRRETKASTAFCDRPPGRKRSTRGASWRRIATAFSTSFGWPN